MSLFQDIKYFLPSSFPEDRAAELRLGLNQNGAVAVDSMKEATHIITDTNRFECWQDVDDTVAVVKDLWVDRSLTMGKLQRTAYYSPDPAFLFSGVVACSADLSAADAETLSAGITALGGQWRLGLTRDVTHMFAVSRSSDKYKTAMQYQEVTRINIILPHWFDDVIRLGMGSLDVAIYQWPDPPYLKDTQQSNLDDAKKLRKLDPDKKVLYKTALLRPDSDLSGIPVKNVWEGRRVLLSTCLELSEGRREAVEKSIRMAQGTILDYRYKNGDGDEEEELDKPYFKAARTGKTIGTLAWLFNVQATGTLSRPVDQLLHYPIPRKPVEGFSSHIITITNYTGETRDYLKKLIDAMGASFTANMSGANTVVIAAYQTGVKVTKAQAWSIPVVNHTWLEDCFIKWRNLTVGLEKYIGFAPNMDFSQLLGGRGVGRAVEDLAELEREEMEDREYLQALQRLPIGTENGAMDATEVAEFVNLPIPDADGDVSMNDAPAILRKPNRGDRLEHESKLHPSPRKADSSSLTKPDMNNKPTADHRGVENNAVPIPSHRNVGIVDEVLDISDSPEPQMKRIKKRKQSPLEITVDNAEVQKSGPSKSTPQKATRARRKNNSMGVSNPTTIETGDEPEVSMQTASIHDGRRRSTRSGPTASTVEARPRTKTAPTLTPLKRVVSVLMPPMTITPRSAVINTAPSQNARTPLGHDTSLHITAEERRGTLASGSKPKPAAPSPKNSSPLSAVPEMSPRMKRSAAAKASQRLKDTVMPDVVNFQQEMRRRPRKSIGNDTSNRRKRTSGTLSDSDHENDSRPKKKGRLSTGSDKGKARSDESGNEEDDATRPVRRIRPQKTKRPVPNNNDSDNDNDETSGGTLYANKLVEELDQKPVANTKGKKKASQSAHNANSSQKASKVVKLMTTQVPLSDDHLIKLGVKLTTRPSECTHLLAPHVVRTEKFLCALAVSPWILSPEWATESVASNRLLPENDFLLQDQTNERKYDFQLSHAVAKAKTLKGQLFEKMVFYVTAKVSVDHKLLKNVITAFGGQVSTQTPTIRVLKSSSNRHIISCAEDISIWRPIAQQFPIYTQELVLTGALKQEVEWDNKAFQLSEP
ncbi:uncharacterized protein EV420DRAFT_1531024 [Desarmillaria tabescens]|uniref:BRCT domain-containing protein n=1 Tax=Armillaria tabescens TaxID=1929756 RepID=A0AA39TR91_ARMTA|nr:uncharacterized protein EV420DRAFT_1531024 [Desarmillaria tabescens]KAK0461234.1 hypothetical protein EV420DRAFT_1531024 [Desarmillaria tabescens]